MTAITESANWVISKPSIKGKQHMVCSQHHLATKAGVEVLRAGGNAMDAAIATGLMLGVVEPWMSGFGGGGYLLTYQATEERVYQIDFGMQAPLAAEPGLFKLADSGTNSSDAFNWPAVQGDQNIHGPLAIAVPCYFKGIELAHRQFATMGLGELARQATEQANKGLPIDWYSTSKINQAARGLRQYPSAAALYLDDGLPPTPNLDGAPQHHPLPGLYDTLEAFAQEGAKPLFLGDQARLLIADLKDQGAILTMEDLESVTASLTEPVIGRYRGHQVFTAGALTAGPSLLDALSVLESQLTAEMAPMGAQHVLAIANALSESYAHRLTHMGAAATAGATTHICVADGEGNVVSLTQTIMSAFGSRIASPQLGFVLNNGMMWFDPRPGHPNSVAPSRKPLCNMCPTLLRLEDGSWAALGACGGRKIFPSVFQLVSYMIDAGMSVHDAAHAPRIDISGSEMVTIMSTMPEDIINELTETYPRNRVRANDVSPAFFALPQLLKREPSGELEGACFIPSPHALVGAD